ncbi:unnamed protein product [Adineta steineri]|uniref:Prohormone-4 n=2 Tax=Adineta steineri TaxID=433720 RepID=A0A813N674_9BILA|nr:unnamed protein product [Adineta steineri]
MTKSISSLLIILIFFFLTAIFEVTPNSHFVRPYPEGFQSHWLTNSNDNKDDFLKRWFDHKRVIGSNKNRAAASSLFNVLHPVIPFKGCIDPSEPFQCPQSQQCIALQFICDGHPGDCPDNLDENEETCIAAKRPAKENIEKFLHAAYTLHGSKLFTFLFGEKLSRSIDENKIFWFDTLASAFSVSKNIHSFAEKTFMSSGDLAHFRNIFQLIHDGRLEDIPLFAQEAVNQGLAALVEKLYDSGFMD